MPDVYYYVNPDADSGGDGTTSGLTGSTCAFDSLSQAFTTIGNPGTNKQVYIYCERNSSSTYDTTAATGSASLGSSTFIKVVPNDTTYCSARSFGSGADGSSYHGGVFDTGTAYVLKLVANYTIPIYLSSDDYAVNGIEVQCSRTATGGSGISEAQTTAYAFYDLIVRDIGSVGTSSLIRSLKGQWYNCIANGNGSTVDAFYVSNYGASAFWNCLAYNAGSGFERLGTNGTAPIVRNCITYSCTDDYTGTFDGTNSDDCVSDQNQSDGFVTITTLNSGDFTTVGSDWSLASGSDCISADDDDDGPSVDIVGNTRSSSYDAGPFEYVSSGLSIDVSTASYSISGGTLTFNRELKFPVSTASYAISGGTLSMARTLPLDVSTATYAISGGTLGFTRQLVLDVSTANYTIAGGTLNIDRTLTFPVSTATYTIAGGDLSMAIDTGLSITPETATYSISGGTLGFSRSLVLPVATATYSISGGTIGFSRELPLSVSTANYTISGGTLGFNRTLVINPQTANYYITGGSLTLSINGIPLTTGRKRHPTPIRVTSF